MTESKHTLTTFDEALADLRNNVLIMASLAMRNLTNALSGLEERDNDLCLQVIADDEEIDQLEKQIDQDGVDLLIRFQPVASDLRRVVVAMKLSPNLERIGDESVSIARKARKLNQHPPLPEVNLIQRMGVHASAMVKGSIEAYIAEDEMKGRAVTERDEALDLMNAEAARALLARVPIDPAQLRGYLNLMFIAAHLERIGDHATNMGEEIVYLAAAKDIRHQPESA